MSLLTGTTTVPSLGRQPGSQGVRRPDLCHKLLSPPFDAENPILRPDLHPLELGPGGAPRAPNRRLAGSSQGDLRERLTARRGNPRMWPQALAHLAIGCRTRCAPSRSDGSSKRGPRRKAQQITAGSLSHSPDGRRASDWSTRPYSRRTVPSAPGLKSSRNWWCG